MDFQITVENIFTYLKPTSSRVTRDTIHLIEGLMSYTIEEYARSRKAFVEFDYTLFERDTLRYPTGLFTNLFNFLEVNKFTYEIIDKRRQYFSDSKLEIHGKKLRDYQQETIEKAISAERGIIKIATGGGKTVVAAGIIANLNLKTLFIVNSLDLLEQTYDEFGAMLQVPIGRIGGGYFDIQKVNVCTIQTLHSALGLKYEAIDEDCYIKEKIARNLFEKKSKINDLIQSCEVVINDEVHHSKAISYVNMMKAAENAYYKFGISGTPFKYDSTDILLNAYSGKEIVNYDASYLIDRGFLVPPKIYFLDPNNFFKYKFVYGRFLDIYRDWIVENKKRNRLILDCAERLLELNKTVLITINQIKHGELLMEMFEKRFPKSKAAFIRGEVDKDERKRLLNLIRERKLDVLIGSSVADEGLDLPALDSAIIGGGGKSLIKTLQRVGRTLRPYPDAEHNIKKEAIIVDFFDHTRYLTGQSRKRIKIYQQERRFKICEHF